MAILGKPLPTEWGLAALVPHSLEALFLPESRQPIFGIHKCTVLMLSRCVRQRGLVLPNPTIVPLLAESHLSSWIFRS